MVLCGLKEMVGLCKEKCIFLCTVPFMHYYRLCEISEFHEKLEAKLGCHLPNFQVFHERKKSDLHD